MLVSANVQAFVRGECLHLLHYSSSKVSLPADAASCELLSNQVLTFIDTTPPVTVTVHHRCELLSNQVLTFIDTTDLADGLQQVRL